MTAVWSSGPAAVADPAHATPVVEDERMLAWRDVFAGSAAVALRAYRAAWSAPGLDDGARAVAAVGVLDAADRRTPLRDRIPRSGVLAEIVAAADLDAGSEAVLAAAWWSSVDPQLAVAFGCVHDDPARRYPSLGLVALLLRPLGIHVPLTLGAGHRLVQSGLLDPVPSPDLRVALPAATAALLAAAPPSPPSAGPVVPRLAEVVRQVAALVRAGGEVLVRCEAEDDREVVRDAVAARLGMALPEAPRPPRLSALLFRLGRELPALLVAPGEAPAPGTLLAVGDGDCVAQARWHTVDVEAPSLPLAERCWRVALRRSGLRPAAAEVTALAGRLPLGERGICEVVAHGVAAAAARGDRVRVGDVGAALRAQPPHDPGGLARRVAVTAGLDDLVLPRATREALAEVVAHARFSPAALARLGLDDRRGRAVIALFHGPSGTGKTAAAEGVAAAVDRDLWVVDLAKVVSKWLGETQRNLDAVLHEAATAGVVLLFDEADGLFGKRGEVTDAHDRYANLEIDHLLQRVEQHTGVVLLTSNRPAALDDAFARRIRLSVRFDLPDHREREALWRAYLPAHLLAEGADTAAAAREELSGAAIRAAAVSATVLALADGTGVCAGHLARAVRRELEKARRPLTARSASS